MKHINYSVVVIPPYVTSTLFTKLCGIIERRHIRLNRAGENVTEAGDIDFLELWKEEINVVRNQAVLLLYAKNVLTSSVEGFQYSNYSPKSGEYQYKGPVSVKKKEHLFDTTVTNDLLIQVKSSSSVVNIQKKIDIAIKDGLNKKITKKLRFQEEATFNIIIVVERVLKFFEEESRRKHRTAKYPVDYSGFVCIFKNRQEELAHVISEVFILVWSDSTINCVSVPYLNAILASRIHRHFFKEERSWDSFGGDPKHPSRVLTLFIKNILIEFEDLNSEAFYYKQLVSYDSRGFFKSTTFIFSKESFEDSNIDLIECFDFIDLPRLVPYPNWEDVPGKGYLILPIKYEDKDIPYYTPTTSTKVKATFAPKDNLLNVFNFYQSQAFYVNIEVLDFVNSNPEMFSGVFFPNETPLFGLNIKFSDCYYSFLDYCEEETYLAELGLKDIQFFTVPIFELNIIFSINRKIFSFLYISAQIKKPLYFRYSIDFRGRDALPTVFNPVNSLLVRHSVFFNQEKEKELTDLGFYVLVAYVVNLFYSKKYFTESEAFKCIFEGDNHTLCVSTDLKTLSAWVQARLDTFEGIKNDKHLLQVIGIKTYLVSNKIPFIGVYLDAPASALQLLVAISGDYSKFELVNLLGCLDGRETPYVDPYIVFAVPSNEDLQKEPRLKTLNRSIKKIFFMLKSFNAGKKTIKSRFIEEGGLSDKDAKACFDYLTDCYKTTFDGSIKFIDFLEGKYSTPNGVSIDFPLFSIHYKYFVEKKGRPKIFVQDQGTKKEVETSVNYYRDTWDAGQHKKSFVANLIHSTDAYVKNYVVEQFEKKGFNILTVHDCFKVHPNHASFARKCYNEAILKVIDMFKEDRKAFGIQKRKPRGFDKKVLNSWHSITTF